MGHSTRAILIGGTVSHAKLSLHLPFCTQRGDLGAWDSQLNQNMTMQFSA